MLEIITGYNDYFFLEKYEIKKKAVSYTIETAEYLYKKYNTVCYMIIGTDLVDAFNTWKDYKELEKYLKFIIVNRGGVKFNRKRLNFFNDNYILPEDISMVSISSSLIRDNIKNKKSFRYMVPEKIFDFIKKKSLYL